VNIFRAVWALPILALVAGSDLAAAETRIALIITNGAYSGPVLSRLDSPYRDGEVLGSALAKAGFEVLPIVRDANQQAMRAALNEFARMLRRAGADAVGFFYYSGHGAALAERGENYLIPTGTQIEETSELSFNAVGLTEIVRLIDEAQPKAGFVVIDACRDVPFKGLKGGGPKGFVVQSAAKGMIIGFATRPGETAEATNAYSSAMASAIATPGLDATAMFKDVQRKVANATGGRQVPWIEDGLLAEFRFTEAAASNSPASVSQSPSGATAAPTRTAVIVTPAAAPRRPASSSRCGGAVLVSVSSRSARPLSASEECALKPKDAFRECNTCPEMVVVPAGGFTMGSPTTEKDRDDNEGPQHTVTIAHAFAVGMFTVTVDQFAEFAKASGYDAGSKCYNFEDSELEGRAGRSFRNPGFSQTGSDPALCLNLADATAYAQWLSKKTGRAYRLLTEAEWEYAARAGTSTRYFWGDEIGSGNANCHGCGSQWDDKQTAPVGSFKPNAFGLYDMQGNASQWVEDCWQESYQGAPTDGSAWSEGNCTRRVVRGGSWDDHPRSLRATFRTWVTLRDRHNDVGFRLGRTLTP
jgi:formylglycine-generating enzyme required for sulfatase activity